MPSDRAQKIIQILHGDHTVSPHLTSLKNEALDVSNDHLTRAEVVVEQPRETKPNKLTPINLNLTAPIVQPKIEEKIEPKKPITVVPAKIDVSSQKKAHERSKLHKITQKRTFKFPSIELPKINVRAIAAFVLLAFAIVTPLKAITTYEQLQTAKSSVESLRADAKEGVGKNFDAVSDQIIGALRTFHSANETLKKIDPAEEFVLRHTPVIGQQYGVTTRLVAAGEHVSLAATSYMQLFRTLKTKGDAPLIERLSLFFEGNRAVVSDLSAAADLVRPIDTTILPENQQAFVSQARDAILALDNDAEYLSSVGPIILSTLGNSSPRRYLIVFQNSSELRPTGGFIGSFALLDIENGEVKNLSVPPGGSYDLQGSLKADVFAPLPMHLINARWEFQDGNWFPDFPTSAQKLMWFLEKSQGPSVDGVIAVNASILPDLLSIVGPVKLAGENGPELTAENALNMMRASIDTAKISTDDSTKTKPKEIIADAAPAMIATIKSGAPEHFLPLVTALLQGLERRDIQLYSRDADEQKQIASFGWDGALQNNPGGDYLDFIATNLGGEKTDSLITQTIDHQAKISDDGTVTVTVRVKRDQRVSTAAYEKSPNISYVRFYVPTGSTLIKAEGFTTPPENLFQTPNQWEQKDVDLQSVEHEVGIDPQSGTRITNELGHTAFGNWMITTPGGSTEALISYVLPFKIAPHTNDLLATAAKFLYNSPDAANYSVYIQRQSGASKTELTSRVILPDAWHAQWVTDPRAEIANNGALLTTSFDTDIHYGLTANIYATSSSTTSTN